MVALDPPPQPVVRRKAARPHPNHQEPREPCMAIIRACSLDPKPDLFRAFTSATLSLVARAFSVLASHLLVQRSDLIFRVFDFLK